MRRYELMLVLKPDVPDDRVQAVLEKVTRQLVGAGGQVVKQAPWGRRRLAYQIDRYREGSYHILHFEAPADAIQEMERTLLITEDVLRHLVIRTERPLKAIRGKGAEDGTDLIAVVDVEDDLEPIGEQIDESESEAAPAAVD
jgi:small subunit ribosomal protein S6